MHVVAGVEPNTLPVSYLRLRPIIAGGSFASQAPPKAGVGSPASGVASFTILMTTRLRVCGSWMPTHMSPSLTQVAIAQATTSGTMAWRCSARKRCKACWCRWYTFCTRRRQHCRVPLPARRHNAASSLSGAGPAGAAGLMAEMQVSPSGTVPWHCNARAPGATRSATASWPR